MEGADEILAVDRVDRGLAADRAVDLRQERGRNLDIRNAAQQGRGGEAGEIADHAAAQRDERCAALDAQAKKILGELLEMPEILGLLARRQHDRRVRDAGRVEPGLEPLRDGGRQHSCP